MRTAADVIASRHSIRAFKQTPVPQDTVETLISLAQQAPSWCNTQPWSVTLLESERLKHLCDSLLTASRATGARFDVQPPTEYVGVYNQRRRESGYALYESLGIARNDRAARLNQAERNFEFFGAPLGAVITVDTSLGPYGLVDTGSYVATFLLAAESLGLGAVAQAAIAMHADVVRDELAIPETQQIVCGIAVGFADTEHPVNSFRTNRERVEPWK